jgi:dTDP-glucose 4,6-dehydratase
MRVLITGGAGFIGSHYVDLRLARHTHDLVVVLDKLTYAGNLANLDQAKKYPRFKFVRGDICNPAVVDRVVRKHRIDIILNFAAETHVDRSLLQPADFARTDVLGTQTLLEAVRKYKLKRFVQISTDEVYGSIAKGRFRETDPLHPSSPYSASKAGGDLQVMAYRHTYGLPVIITRSSNNFGPRQYPEKLIPLFVTNAIEGKMLPLYGDGLHMRDWIYVEDNCLGIDYILEHGRTGEIYNLGAGNTRSNWEITRSILGFLKKPHSLIRRMPDRLGHDRRYALHIHKVRNLGWKTVWDFSKAMRVTIQWYLDNPQWWRPLKSGAYLRYYKKQYGERHRCRK